MRRRWFIAAIVAACLVAFASGGRWIPFWITNDVTSVLAGWLHAGMSCEGPELGMPGPTADWVCRRSFAGADVGARLLADRNGVQSIIAGVPAGTPGDAAAKAFVELLEVTPIVRSGEAELSAWLLASKAADGVMPAPGDTGIGRASVDRDEFGHTVLYLTPLGSTILLDD